MFKLSLAPPYPTGAGKNHAVQPRVGENLGHLCLGRQRPTAQRRRSPPEEPAAGIVLKSVIPTPEMKDPPL